MITDQTGEKSKNQVLEKSFFEPHLDPDTSYPLTCARFQDWLPALNRHFLSQDAQTQGGQHARTGSLSIPKPHSTGHSGTTGSRAVQPGFFLCTAVRAAIASV